MTDKKQLKAPEHSTACLYGYALARLGLTDTPQMRVLFWDAHEALKWDEKTDRYIPPSAEGECSQCGQIQEPAAAQASEVTPVVVPDDMPSTEANIKYGESYGVDWEYEGKKAAPAAVAVPDERAAFEATNITGRYYRSSEPGCADEYADPHTQLAWKSWQARAALAATPAAVEVPAEGDPAALLQLAYLIESGRGMNYVERKEIAVALRVLAATPAAAAPLPLLVRDIARELGITCTEACLALKPLGNFSTNTAVTAEMMAKLRECFPERVPASEVAGARERMTAGRACYFMERFLKEEKLLGPNEQAALHYVIDVLEAAAAPVVLPEPDAVLRVVVDGDTPSVISFNTLTNGEYGVFYGSTVRALLAGVSAPAALAVERGEVLVTVSGFTGSGKSAIAGEIEIMCRALGLQVEWPDSDSEKHMTHADWIAALEQYKPRVRIVECNVPHSVVKGQDK